MKQSTMEWNEGDISHLIRGHCKVKDVIVVLFCKTEYYEQLYDTKP